MLVRALEVLEVVIGKNKTVTGGYAAAANVPLPRLRHGRLKSHRLLLLPPQYLSSSTLVLWKPHTLPFIHST